ncbi:MAG: phosphoglycerate kinase [Methanobacteriaceae archaeon]|nr:phosphoglycerate kinase [Methanobacteriaceae archaeon]
MNYDFNTIDDFDFEGKTVLLRVDINSPVDPSTGIILDDTRIRLHSDTIDELSNKMAKVVIIAHQSRPGKSDFTTLAQHADAISNTIGKQVKYIDGLFSIEVQNKIKDMENGDILLLENVRFYAEEAIKLTPKMQKETHLIRNLVPLADYFVNDAFAAAHRSQTSLIGFAELLPSMAGRVMEKELVAVLNVLDNVQSPCVYLLGGIKADDSIMVMVNALKSGSADYILTTGLVANIFLTASGVKIKDYNENFIKERGFEDYIEVARDLLKDYSDKILMPLDVAILENDGRVEYDINEIPDLPIYDIGSKTVKLYCDKIREAHTIFANGPAGVFEKEGFNIGTADLLNSMASSKASSVICGGHLAAAAGQMNLEDGITHISTGGGASINLVAGQELPAVKALIKSAKRN